MLERPELFNQSLFQPFAASLGALILENAQLAEASSFQPNISILVRTKNDEVGLTRIFQHVYRQRQTYSGRIDAIVVDTESQDSTRDIAQDFGALVVPITQEEFSYPKGINSGMSEVRDDSIATFITVGHAQPVVSNCLQAAARHFERDAVTGVYGSAIPHENASIGEKILFSNRSKAKNGVHSVLKSGMGVFGATNCMVRMETWHSRPFDEAYAAGGEDTAWAKDALRSGEEIVYDPAVNVHHTHGLGPINLYRQFVHWSQVVKGPRDFSNKGISARRPDLFE